MTHKAKGPGCNTGAIEAGQEPPTHDVSVAALQREVEELRADAGRLDWLLHHISGKEMRRIGIETSAGGPLWGRVALDAAMASKAEVPNV